MKIEVTPDDARGYAVTIDGGDKKLTAAEMYEQIKALTRGPPGPDGLDQLTAAVNGSDDGAEIGSVIEFRAKDEATLIRFGDEITGLDMLTESVSQDPDDEEDR